jgi:Ni,Fe-hydrogenase III large subunit/Ni,Fe-hydrogenase III component G
MPLRTWLTRATPLANASELRVTREEWKQFAASVAATGGRLLALWGSHGDADDVVRAAYVTDVGLLIATLFLKANSDYAGIEQLFPCANRMQRAMMDLSGARASATDSRPWLRHRAWEESFHPLAEARASSVIDNSEIDDYPFVQVEGDGVHEIPVGPVHAGIIEPGHFRFSIVGEKVLRLEERLGYVHKGIERRFTELSLAEGHRLAARVSGDSAVAYSWAYCQALENITALDVPPRAVWLRALALELERIANHLGDLGALGNDAGFAFGLAQFSRLKEELLRVNERAFGQRYLMDFIVPGGTRVDLAATSANALCECVRSIANEVATLRSIYEEHAGVRDRFVGAGIVTPELARQLGLIGVAGRASNQNLDLRCDFPCAPYDELTPNKVTYSDGDVGARVAIRFDETVESIRLVQEIIMRLPSGAHSSSLSSAPDGALGLGLIEGWRGPVLIALEAGREGTIRRCHPHDPSWQNWPVLEHAVIGNIVPDFPLINKSFNLSYSGHDL